MQQRLRADFWSARVRTFLLVIFGFSLGVIAGGWAVFWALDEFMLQPISISQPSYSAVENMAVLNALREGKADNGIALLEYGLDTNVIALGVFPKERLDKQTISTLSRIAEYRQKYPFNSSDPTVAAHVSSVLSKYSGAHTNSNE